MSFEKLEQVLNKSHAPKASKVKSLGGADFGSMMDAVSAMGSTATTAGSMYGGSTASAAITAAFSGIGAAAAQSQQALPASYMSGSMGSGMGGGDVPYLANGFSTGAKYAASTTDATGSMGGLNSNAAVIPGTEGFSQMDMINTMNQNNLQLLELQAVMQSNMQAWNTKSNILSADHRARMAMIEKFTAR